MSNISHYKLRSPFLHAPPWSMIIWAMSGATMLPRPAPAAVRPVAMPRYLSNQVTTTDMAGITANAPADPDNLQ